MAVDRHVVGRIDEHQQRLLAAQEPGVGVVPGGVGAQQAMPPELPEIARAAHRRRRPVDRRHPIGLVRCARIEPVEQDLDLRRLEPAERQVDIDLELGDEAQLMREQPLVPAGKLGNPVLGDREQAKVAFRQALDGERRHHLEAETFRRPFPERRVTAKDEKQADARERLCETGNAPAPHRLAWQSSAHKGGAVRGQLSR